MKYPIIRFIGYKKKKVKLRKLGGIEVIGLEARGTDGYY
jgi:hypothetical protein